jgi:deoxycytidylate deaminase
LKILDKLTVKAKEHNTGSSHCNHVAAIIYRNRVVAWGTNSYKSHPLQLENSRNPESIFLHAEIDVLIKASKVLTVKEMEKASIVVMRLYKKGGLAPSKPCSGCQKYITSLGIKKVIFTKDGQWNIKQS